jgi:hypothetical protein
MNELHMRLGSKRSEINNFIAVQPLINLKSTRMTIIHIALTAAETLHTIAVRNLGWRAECSFSGAAMGL